MIRSMTGYGDAELDTAVGRLRAEVRTVNHRYFSLNLRMGRALERFEPLIRESLRALLPRGHVNCALRLDTGDVVENGVALRLDSARARQYLRLLQSLKEELGVPGDIDLALLARFSELIVAEEEADNAGPDGDDVRRVVEAAAHAAASMREQEGRRLADDLGQRLDGIERAMEQIRDLAPNRLLAERDRMRRVVAELMDGIPIDEERIAREIAFMAERWDISEELVRLRSHIDLFRESLAGTSFEPIGKRLSFLTQEMNRETNTIGSKANDTAIEHRVIAIKDEIERLREQIENVE